MNELKLVYQYDEDGFYLGETYADPDPMEEGNWLIPGRCTEVKPPKEGITRKAKWVDDNWEIVKIEAVKEELEDENSSFTITPRQLRTWLIINDYSLEDVEKEFRVINDEKQRKIALVEWEYALAHHRGSLLAIYLPKILQLSENQIDDLFKEAKKL